MQCENSAVNINWRMKTVIDDSGEQLITGTGEFRETKKHVDRLKDKDQSYYRFLTK